LVVHLFISGGCRKVSIALSPEAARLLEQEPGLKCKAALGTVYGAGLRVSEVLALKVSDIDSARMMIRIGRSKRRNFPPDYVM
jgi:integrase/recombinase XerD